jgi:hypothetical protein
MKRDQQQFFVTLFSNSSQSLFADNTIATFTIHLAQPIELGSIDNWEVGFYELTYPLHYSTGLYAGITVVGDTNVSVYCNLVSLQFVGGALVLCLRTYIIPSLHCQHFFENAYYLPVEKRSFQDIRIELLTMESKRHSFNESTTAVKAVLHFRRISAS